MESNKIRRIAENVIGIKTTDQKLTELKMHVGGAVASIKQTISSINVDITKGDSGIKIAKQKAQDLLDDSKILFNLLSNFLEGK